MDCLLCYKIFVKEKEFGEYNPDPQLCKKEIVKLFEISKNPNIQRLSDDLVACFGCHLKMGDGGGLVDQLEELQRRVSEAKIEILNELLSSKELNQTMAERTAANRMSPSSQDRCILLKAIEALNSPPQTAHPMDQIEDGPIGENAMDGGIHVQNEPPETRAQIGMGMDIVIGANTSAPNHDNIDTGDSESFHEEENQTTECSESEDSSDEEQDGVLLAGATILQLKDVKICLKRVQLPPGVSKIKYEDKSNHVPSSSKGGYGLRNPKPPSKAKTQVKEPSNEESGSESESGDGSSSDGDTENQNKASVDTNWPGVGTSANARGPPASGFALKEFIRLENGFQCKHCSRIIKHIKSLRVHLLIHSPMRFKCSVRDCGKRFTQKGSRDRHVSMVHERRRDFQCSQCGKKFSTLQYRNLHLKIIHERRKDFKCTWLGCGKRFFIKFGLIRHCSAVHEGKKDFKCNWARCGKSFTQRNNMNRHIKIAHEGCKDFKCGIEGCYNVFGSKQELVRHMKIKHKKMGVAKKKRVGVARVINPQPGSSSQPSNLNRRAKVGHDEAMDYKCGICSKAFARNTNLRRHVSAKHKKMGVA